MPSQLKALRESRTSGTFNLVDKKINRRISSSVSRRRGSRSPTDDDVDRIIDDYIDDDYLDNVTNKKSSELAIKSLEEGKAKKGLIRDFTNFISGVGRKKLVNKLYDRYAVEKSNLIEKEKIKTKSGKERVGYKVNSRVYLINILTKTKKRYIQARRFKDNRIVKLRKSYLVKLR